LVAERKRSHGHREGAWCSAQRIKIRMIACGNHTFVHATAAIYRYHPTRCFAGTNAVPGDCHGLRPRNDSGGLDSEAAGWLLNENAPTVIAKERSDCGDLPVPSDPLLCRNKRRTRRLPRRFAPRNDQIWTLCVSLVITKSSAHWRGNPPDRRENS